jgi:hypothetical protein
MLIWQNSTKYTYLTSPRPTLHYITLPYNKMKHTHTHKRGACLLMFHGVYEYDKDPKLLESLSTLNSPIIVGPQ